MQQPMSPRSFNVHLLWPSMIDESSVEFVDQRHEDKTDTKQHDNHSPTPINIPLCKQDLGIRLIHSSDDKNKIIGYQLFLKANKARSRRPGQSQRWTTIVANRIYRPLFLGSCKPEEITISCHQMVGIPAWDGKADVIFGGRPSCSSLCPMGCCMRTRDMLPLKTTFRICSRWKMRYGSLTPSQ